MPRTGRKCSRFVTKKATESQQHVKEVVTKHLHAEDTWHVHAQTPGVQMAQRAAQARPMRATLNSGTYQPVWDAWQRFLQPLVSQV